MRSIQRVFFAGIASCLITISCHAQPVTGTPQFASLAGTPDVVNLGNLNAYWDFPIINKAGRGQNFTWDITYNSSIWYPVTSSGTKTWTPVANWGWQGLTNVGTSYASYNVSLSSGNCGQYNQYSYEEWAYSNITYTDQTGFVHLFSGGGVYISSPSGSNQCPPNGAQPAQPQTTTNNGMSVKWLPAEGYLNLTFYDANGNTINPVIVTNPPAQQGSYINTDRNGNEISYNGNGGFIDTLGLQALAIAGTAPSNTTLTVANPSGTGATYTVAYQGVNIKTNFNCPNVNEYTSPGTVYLVSSITLPDQRTYQFKYENWTSGSTTYYTGRIVEVDLPNSGKVTYQYSGGDSGTGIVCADGSTAGMTRTTPDGAWTYSRSGSGTQWTTTMTSPLGDDTLVGFLADTSGNFYEIKHQIYSGSQGGGNLQRTILTCYSGNCSNTAGDTASSVTLPVSQRQTTIQMPSSTSSAYGYAENFDANLNLTYRTTHDVGSGGNYSSTILSTTQIQYESFSVPNGPLNLPQVVKTLDGSNNVVAQTEYGYDESSVTATSNTPQHVTGSNVGNVTSIHQCLTSGCTGSGGALTSTFTYYDTGNVKAATDVNNAQTTYVYGSGSSCGNSFPTAVDYPLSLTTSTAWNCNGGVQISSTDFNGNQTTYSYTDPNYWVVRQTTDPWGNVTNYTYPGAGATGNTSEVAMNFNGSASTSDVLTQYDDLGRALLTEQRQGPGGFTFNVTQNVYDSLGRPTSSTLPYALVEGKTPDPSYPGTTTTYDVLSRVSQVNDSGGGWTTQGWNQNDDLVTVGPAPGGENSKSRQLEYDGLGRLTSVCEVTAGTSGSPGGSCGQAVAATGYLTKYTYDGASRLTGVAQNAQASGNHQTRSVSYDWLGRKTQETIPETGTTQYTYDSDSTCGSYPGDLVKIQDNMGNVTCMAYDALHRMTSAKVQSGGNYYNGTQQTYYVYDVTSNPPAQLHNAAGNLVEAYTCQSSGCSSGKLTDIFFSTSNAGGGMLTSQMWETTANSGGHFYMTQDTYYPNGTVQAISATYNSATITGMPSMTYGVNGLGQLINATDAAHSNQKVASSTCYTSGGQVTGIVLGNGDGDAFGYDWKTMRPTSFQYNITGSNAFNIAGSLSWNANASLASMNLTDSNDPTKNQNCTYSADDLQRLVTVSCGGQWAQSFSYDTFGNITKSGSVNYAATYAAGTNQESNGLATYDSNGNVTVNSRNWTLGWNAAGQPVTVNNTVATIGATYDALGRMVETNNQGTYTQYIYRPSGDKLGAFRAGALLSASLPLPGGMSAVYNNNGLNYIRHMDYLGSSRLATTWAHGIYSKESYAPFGEAYNEAGTTDRVFTGQTQDTTSGVYDYLFRKYDPTAGRWMSPDPAGWGAVDQTAPQSLNRYAYIVNNPMGAIDLSGLACVSIDLAGNVSVDNWGPDSMNAALCANDGGNYQDGFVDPYAINNVYYSPTDRTASYSYGDGSWGGTMIESGQAVYQGVFLTEALFFARTPPQASFSGPLPSISSGGSAPSRNFNMSDQWPFNGNVIPGTHPQDGVCTTGPLADTMNSDPLVLACCQAHDNCYAQHQCNASSWVPINPGVCTACNARAVACIKQAILP